MNSNIFIPEKINVGYQKREDTYTKRLAYVIYYDNKGVLRKEKSWQSWRDSKLGNDEFKNEPTSGFVLNKGVGGARQSWGWNTRNEYIRVYDPRNFEFEISVANLLWILQETSSIKGKGLEGEFVYGWLGTELTLIPTCSQEYTECLAYTKVQDGKISARDLQPGFMYRDSSMEDWIYLGRLDYNKHPYKPYDYSQGYYRNNDYYREKYKREMAKYEKDSKTKKQHVFVSTKKTKMYRNHPDVARYDFPSSMNRYKECLSTVAVENYAFLLQEYEDYCKYASTFKEITYIPIPDYEIEDMREYTWGSDFYIDEEKHICKFKNLDVDDTIITMERDRFDNDYRNRESGWNEMSLEEFRAKYRMRVKAYNNKYIEKT